MELTVIDADPLVGATTISKELPENNKAIAQAKSIMSISEYDFIEMSYHGDGNYRDGTLVRPHEREDGLSYLGRREMAFLKNFVRPIINARIDPVYSEEIIRQLVDENGEKVQAPYCESFLKDCDNSGTPFSAFMEQAARDGNRQTLVFIVVDNHIETGKTVGESLEKRSFPYAYTQARNTVENYAVNKFGALEWIRFEDREEKDASGKIISYYRYWDSQKSELQREEKDAQGKEVYVMVEESYHKLGFLPVYPFAFMPRRKKDCLSIDYEFYDLCRCNWTIYNLDSATMEAIFDQCFSLLCIQGPKTRDVAVGTKSICWVDMTAPNMPAFVSPDPNVASIASTFAGNLKREIFEIAEQNGVTAVKKDGGVVEQSGKAKEWDFQAHGFILTKIATLCARAEQWVIKTVCAYTGEKVVYVPKYRKNFAVVNTDVVIDTQVKVLDNSMGVKAETLAKKNIAMAAFVHNTKEDLDIVIADIESMEADKENAEVVVDGNTNI